MPRNDGTLTFVRPGKALYGEVRAGYLVTVVRGGRERPLVWRPPEPLPLDLREEWEMHWMPEGMSARQFSGSGEKRRPRQVVPIPDRAIDTGAAVALFGSPDNDRPDFAVRVQRLRPILPPNKRPPADVGRNQEAAAVLYSGAGDSVTDAVSVQNQFAVFVDDRRAVQFMSDNGVATLLASLPGFQCRIGDSTPQDLIPNVPLDVDLSSGEYLEIRSGKLWWHLTTVPAPEPFLLGPEDAPSPESEREEARLRRFVAGIFIATLVALTLLFLFAPDAVKTTVVPAETAELKIKPAKRVAPAAPAPLPARERPSNALNIEVPRVPVQPRWTVERQAPEPERPSAPSLADAINRAADAGRAGGAAAAGGDIDPRVRSPRQERRRREVADGRSMRLTVSGAGQIDRSEVEASLEGHLGQFQRCYVNALERDPRARGNVLLEWTIARTGMVTDVVTIRTDINDEPMLRCIDEEVRRVRFPVPVDGAVRVQYPFVFRALGE